MSFQLILIIFEHLIYLYIYNKILISLNGAASQIIDLFKYIYIFNYMSFQLIYEYKTNGGLISIMKVLDKHKMLNP